MPVELKIPEVGESITEVEIGQWLKSEGEQAIKDENLVVIETEKVTIELPAPVSGKITKILKKPGDIAAVGEVIGYMEPGAAEEKPAPEQMPAGKEPPSLEQPSEREALEPEQKPSISVAAARIMPPARRVLAESGRTAAEVQATGPGGRLLKEDVLRREARDELGEERPATTPLPFAAPEPRLDRRERAVAMSPMRRRIAERLVAAQRNAALLTTFNEIDMSAVIAVRANYQAHFQERYRVKLGFMSFFVKAAIDALKVVPQVNAEIRGTDIVYRDYYDIGIAVGSERGLVVPILRNAEKMAFAEIELAIDDFARRAQDGKLKLDELQGGTFTISNGGIYGSLLSTPIINPPQSGILGMHVIQERPVARENAVVIRPMMYVALTYDHRIVDGREAVVFLRRIKETIEEPARMLLEV